MIIHYCKDGIFKTELIEEDELLWYLTNTTVYRVH